MSLFAAAFTCGIASLIYLRTRSARADQIAVAGAELAVVFGIIVLTTGPLWARKTWGIWWDWDAKLTSTLVMWLIFSSYLPVSYTHLRAHETPEHLVCRLLLEK